MDTRAQQDSRPLLGPGDPTPLRLLNPEGRSPFLLVCEHAGNAIPAALGDLGLDETERSRHIAWDIGAAAVAEGLSHQLDATLFIQPYSRLVIDCNRPWTVPSLVPAISDGTPIPANAGLDAEQRQIRWREIHQPFHAAIHAELERRPQRALLTIHSFTPSLRSNPIPRAVQLGLLYGQDSRLADALLDALNDGDQSVRVERNQPYAVDEESDYAIPVHGLARGIPNLLLEIRQDQIDTAEGQTQWIRLLSAALQKPSVQTLLQDAL